MISSNNTKKTRKAYFRVFRKYFFILFLSIKACKSPKGRKIMFEQNQLMINEYQRFDSKFIKSGSSHS